MKNLITLLALIISLNAIAQNDRVLTLKYNSDSVVYAKDGVYHLNKETTPLTATVIEIGRWSHVIDQESYYKDGVKVWVSEYDSKGVKESTIYYYHDRDRKKSALYYNPDGTIARKAEWDKKGYLVNN